MSELVWPHFFRICEDMSAQVNRMDGRIEELQRMGTATQSLSAIWLHPWGLQKSSSSRIKSRRLLTPLEIGRK